MLVRQMLILRLRSRNARKHQGKVSFRWLKLRLRRPREEFWLKAVNSKDFFILMGKDLDEGKIILFWVMGDIALHHIHP